MTLENNQHIAKQDEVSGTHKTADGDNYHASKRRLFNTRSNT